MNEQFITDPIFGGCTCIEMYLSWVIPDLYPKNPRPQPRLENWTDEDIEMFCGTRKEIN